MSVPLPLTLSNALFDRLDAIATVQGVRIPTLITRILDAGISTCAAPPSPPHPLPAGEALEVPMRYELADILAAHAEAPTPILQEAVERWLAAIVVFNRDGLADDDPVLVRQAIDLVERSVGRTMQTLLHPEEH